METIYYFTVLLNVTFVGLTIWQLPYKAGYLINVAIWSVILAALWCIAQFYNAGEVSLAALAYDSKNSMALFVTATILAITAAMRIHKLLKKETHTISFWGSWSDGMALISLLLPVLITAVKL